MRNKIVHEYGNVDIAVVYDTIVNDIPELLELLQEHANYENDGGEFDNNPNFSPYYGKGIIALDACTVRSHKVNCIAIEDSLRNA